ncbi:hypothetical protein Tco_0103949 [Tanacetum coccineum]
MVLAVLHWSGWFFWLGFIGVAWCGLRGLLCCVVVGLRADGVWCCFLGFRGRLSVGPNGSVLVERILIFRGWCSGGFRMRFSRVGRAWYGGGVPIGVDDVGSCLFIGSRRLRCWVGARVVGVGGVGVWFCVSGRRVGACRGSVCGLHYAG